MVRNTNITRAEFIGSQTPDNLSATAWVPQPSPSADKLSDSQGKPFRLRDDGDFPSAFQPNDKQECVLGSILNPIFTEAAFPGSYPLKPPTNPHR
jgi:hypothetical protein